MFQRGAVEKSLLSLVLALMLSSCAYGMASDDAVVYVRQDVFDAKMEAFMAEIRLSNEQLRREIHDEMRELGARLTVVEGRISSLETMIYWVLGTLAVVFAALAIMLTLLTMRTQAKENPARESYSPSITLDDVRRLIAEAKLTGA